MSLFLSLTQKWYSMLTFISAPTRGYATQDSRKSRIARGADSAIYRAESTAEPHSLSYNPLNPAPRLRPFSSISSPSIGLVSVSLPLETQKKTSATRRTLEWRPMLTLQFEALFNYQLCFAPYVSHLMFCTLCFAPQDGDANGYSSSLRRSTSKVRDTTPSSSGNYNGSSGYECFCKLLLLSTLLRVQCTVNVLSYINDDVLTISDIRVYP